MVFILGFTNVCRNYDRNFRKFDYCLHHYYNCNLREHPSFSKIHDPDAKTLYNPLKFALFYPICCAIAVRLLIPHSYFPAEY